MVFEGGPQVSGRSPEFRHDFTEVACQFGKLFGSKNDQGDHKDDDEMRNTEHSCFGFQDVLAKLQYKNPQDLRTQNLSLFWFLKPCFCIIEEGQRRVKLPESCVLY